MSSNKTILVVIDAFRHDYLKRESTPFLNSLIEKSKYIQKLTPSYGFCERTEILVGLTAVESNYFTAIGFNPENSPYKSLHKILNFVNPFYNKCPVLFKRIFRRLLWEYSSRKRFGFSSVNIPLSYLSFFSLTEDGENSLIDNSEQSLYSILPKMGYKINDKSFTSLTDKQVFDDNGRMKELLKNITDDSSFYMLYLGDCDKYGHLLGPDSKEMDKKLSEIDTSINAFVNDINAINSDVNYVFIGDHGMTNVVEHVDLLNVVEEYFTAFVDGEDYLLFADSTIFRIWVLNSDKKIQIDSIIHNIFKDERVVNFGELTRPEILGFKNDRVYGDYIWCAKNGVLILPDFFNPSYKTVKGMHGFNPKNNHDAQGMAICYGPDFEQSKTETACLTTIYNLITELYREK